MQQNLIDFIKAEIASLESEIGGLQVEYDKQIASVNAAFQSKAATLTEQQKKLEAKLPKTPEPVALPLEASPPETAVSLLDLASGA